MIPAQVRELDETERVPLQAAIAEAAARRGVPPSLYGERVRHWWRRGYNTLGYPTCWGCGVDAAVFYSPDLSKDVRFCAGCWRTVRGEARLQRVGS